MCEAWCWGRRNFASPIPGRVRLPKQPAYLPHASGFDREPSLREAIPSPWCYCRDPAKLARAEKWQSRCFAFADRLQTAAWWEATLQNNRSLPLAPPTPLHKPARNATTPRPPSPDRVASKPAHCSKTSLKMTSRSFPESHPCTWRRVQTTVEPTNDHPRPRKRCPQSNRRRFGLPGGVWLPLGSRGSGGLPQTTAGPRASHPEPGPAVREPNSRAHTGRELNPLHPPMAETCVTQAARGPSHVVVSGYTGWRVQPTDRRGDAPVRSIFREWSTAVRATPQYVSRADLAHRECAHLQDLPEWPCRRQSATTPHLRA